MATKKKSTTAPLLIRIKPFNARRKHFVRVWVHGPSGKRFEERKGWYKIDDERLLASLRKARQLEGDEDSPDVFDICTVEQAKLIDQMERKQSVKRADADNANDLSTSDFGRRKADEAMAPPEDRRTKTIRNLDDKRAERTVRVKSPRGPRSVVAADDAAES